MTNSYSNPWDMWAKPPKDRLQKAEEGYPTPKRQEEWANESSLSNLDDDLGDSSRSMEDLRTAAAKETEKSLVRKETRSVNLMRYAVLFVLMGTAVGVSVATYLYSRSVEQDSFQAEFASVAVVTLRSFVEAVEHSFGSMDAVASGITSHATRTGEVFPNVTVPDFEVKGATARTQTGSIFMFWLPLVTDETRAGYEEYTQQMQTQLFGSYVTEEGLRIYQDAYFGINASETEAAEARAEAEAQQAAGLNAAVEETSGGGGATKETQEVTQIQSYGGHSHDHPENSDNERRRLWQLVHRAKDEQSQDSEFARRQLQTALDQAQISMDMLEKLAQQKEEHRELHVAPPDTGLPPFGHPTIHEQIWGLNSHNVSDGPSWLEPQGTGPYLPMWQLSPTIPLPALVNFNFLDYTDIAPSMTQSLNTGRAVLSYLQTNHQGVDTELLIQIFLTLNQYRHRVVDYNADPMTQLAYPVFDSFHPTEKKVTGILLSAIFWRLLLLDILPENVKGVICVLSNSLGQNVTYQINGREVEYIGVGDLHDTKYDTMGVSRDISQSIAERASVETSSYTTVELDVGYTAYYIHVYPSQTMENTYVTNDPIFYAVIVAFIFVFTSAVFILYDRCVEKRQKKVMGVAVASSAVVTSLFPKVVQDRLFGNNKMDESSRQSADAWLSQNGAADMRRRASMGGNPPLPTLKEGGSSGHMSLGSSERGQNVLGGHSTYMDHSAIGPLAKRKKKKGKVIADKYAATTVFFADLAGFTKWSSTREPEQVFELLEALYGAFDKIALRRAVFKVETIGDCYMAVTGLPNPQADHAIRMVKFARESMQKMDRILNELQYSLGMDTVELAMRVGLHSGPVTAGVLRGDKGRFQLFGDTVNTASRMESNGVKRRIHVSQATADLLPAKWLTAREDKIVAKGKGEMQTYYVEASYEARSTTSALSALSGISELPAGLAGNGAYNREPETKPSDIGSTGGEMRSLAEQSGDTFVNEDDVISDGISELATDTHHTSGGETDINDLDIDFSFKNEMSDDAESFENDPPREEAAPLNGPIVSGIPGRFSMFSEKMARALMLADEISV